MKIARTPLLEQKYAAAAKPQILSHQGEMQN